MNREHPQYTGGAPVQHTYGAAPQHQYGQYPPQAPGEHLQQPAYTPQAPMTGPPSQQSASLHNPAADPYSGFQNPPSIAGPGIAETKSEAAVKQTTNIFGRIHGAGEYVRQSFNSVIDRAVGDTVNADRELSAANEGYNRMMGGRKTRPIDGVSAGMKSEQIMDAPMGPNVGGPMATDQSNNVYPNAGNTGHAGMGNVSGGRM